MAMRNDTIMIYHLANENGVILLVQFVNDLFEARSRKYMASSKHADSCYQLMNISRHAK